MNQRMNQDYDSLYLDLRRDLARRMEQAERDGLPHEEVERASDDALGDYFGTIDLHPAPRQT